MGKAIRESSLKYGWKKVRIKNVYSLTDRRTILFCVCGRKKKLAGKKQNMEPTWNIISWKTLTLGELTSFLDNVYLGSTQREC